MSLETKKNLAASAILCAFLVVLIRTAWIGDDAAITLRTVLNFIHGFGPSFNVDERVQAYTHPLWFLLISLLSLITKDVFASTFVLSILCSAAALGVLLFRISASFAGAVLAGGALVLSKAFVDFSTSGLENPLSHVLIAVLGVAVANPAAGASTWHLRLGFLCFSLLYLTRPDLILLVLPLVLWVAYRERHDTRRLVSAALLGCLPALAWTLFAIYYYGFPFPNPAYAKLGAGIALDERWIQGLRYVLHSFVRDPLTPAFVTMGIILGLRSASASSKAWSLGIGLYLAYVVGIGGDFMEGRFLTAPLFAGAMIAARSAWAPRALLPVGSGVLALSLFSIQSTLLSGARYSNYGIGQNGIADERGFYFQQTGLISASKDSFMHHPEWRIQTTGATLFGGGLGYGSLWRGPGTHAADLFALSDPLLSRLPARANLRWRIGHFARQLPAGYLQTLRLGENRLVDPKTRDFYESIRTITRGPLISHERLVAILRANLGLIGTPNPELYRSGVVVEVVPVTGLAKEVPDGAPWDAPGNIIFSGAVEIVLDEATDITGLTLSLDHNDVYQLYAITLEGETELGIVPKTSKPGMASRAMKLESPVTGVRRLRIQAVGGDDLYSLGHVSINRW